MSSFLSHRENINKIIEISKVAGDAIMDIYETNFDYELKEDNSPLTIADKTSNEIICKSLRDLTPKIPILSEESSQIPFRKRSSWKKYWLIDPLDGTKEFIKRNGEFTVNIALINEGKPVFGVIRVPAQGELYWGLEGVGSYFIDKNDSKNKIHVSDNYEQLKIVSSRSHPSPELQSLLDHGDFLDLTQAGSSLKFCMLAHGIVDAYPRLNPTSEWDIAAGHAIINSAGGTILDLKGNNMIYNSKDELTIDGFFALNNQINFEKFNQK